LFLRFFHFPIINHEKHSLAKNLIGEKQAQNESFVYSVANLASGTYFLTLITNEESKSQLFVVTK